MAVKMRSELLFLLFALFTLSYMEWNNKTALAIHVPISYGNFNFTNASLIVSTISQTVSEGGAVAQNASNCAVHNYYNLTVSYFHDSNSGNNTCADSPWMYKVYNTNTWFPFLISFTTLHLNNTSQLPFSLTSPIAAKYLPRVFQTTPSLLNPLYPSEPITLTMLLQHTSSFVWVNQSLNPVPLPTTPNNPWEDYINVLITTMGNDIFANCNPGNSLLCYRPSFINTALLACILTNIITEHLSSTTVIPTSSLAMTSSFSSPSSITQQTLLEESVNYANENKEQEIVLYNWMHNNIFALLQMINTNFMINPNDANGTVRTTLADGAKLLNATFIDNNNNNNENDINTAFASAVGHAMMRNIVPLSQKRAENNFVFATNITDRGLLLFNRKALCMASEFTDPFTFLYCSFLRDDSYTNNSTTTNNNDDVMLATYIHDTFEESQLTIICLPNQNPSTITENTNIDNDNVISNSVMQKCILTTLSIAPPPPFSTTTTSTSSTSSTTTTYTSSTSSTTTTTSTSSSPTTNNITEPSEPHMDSKTGLYVFLGILCILAVVLLGSYFTDYIIQPAPPAKVLLPMGALHAPTSMQRSVIPILPFTSTNAISNHYNYTGGNNDNFANNTNNITLHNVEGKANYNDTANDLSDRKSILSNTITNTSNKELASKYYDPLATLVVNNNNKSKSSNINTLPSPFYVRESVRRSPNYGLGTTSFIPPTHAQKSSLHHFSEAHAFTAVTPEDILRSAELTTLHNTPIPLELSSNQRLDSRCSEQEEEEEEEEYTQNEKDQMFTNKKSNNTKYSAPTTSSSSSSSSLERSLSSSQYTNTSMTTPIQHCSISHSSLAYRAPSYDNSTRVYPSTAHENVNPTTTTTVTAHANANSYSYSNNKNNNNGKNTSVN